MRRRFTAPTIRRVHRPEPGQRRSQPTVLALPWRIIVEAAPVLTVVGAVLGLAFMRGYLRAFGISVVAVNGFSDYLLAAFYGLSAVAGMVAILMTARSIAKNASPQTARWLVAGLGLVTFILLWRQITLQVVDVIDWLILGTDHKLKAPVLAPLESLSDALRGVAEVWYLPISDTLELFLGFAAAAAIVGAWLARQKPRLTPRLGVAVAALIVVLLGSADQAGQTFADAQVEAGFGGLPGLIFHRDNLVGDNAPLPCACGATAIWRGEKATALLCANTVILVEGPENLTLVRRGDRLTAPSRELQPFVSPIQGWRWEAEKSCKTREHLDALLHQPLPSGPPKVEFINGGWRTSLLSVNGRQRAALICQRGRLFTRLAAAGSNLPAPHEEEGLRWTDDLADRSPPPRHLALFPPGETRLTYRAAGMLITPLTSYPAGRPYRYLVIDGHYFAWLGLSAYLDERQPLAEICANAGSNWPTNPLDQPPERGNGLIRAPIPR